MWRYRGAPGSRVRPHISSILGSTRTLVSALPRALRHARLRRHRHDHLYATIACRPTPRLPRSCFVWLDGDHARVNTTARYTRPLLSPSPRSEDANTSDTASRDTAHAWTRSPTVGHDEPTAPCRVGGEDDLASVMLCDIVWEEWSVRHAHAAAHRAQASCDSSQPHAATVEELFGSGEPRQWCGEAVTRVQRGGPPGEAVAHAHGRKQDSRPSPSSQVTTPPRHSQAQACRARLVSRLVAYMSQYEYEWRLCHPRGGNRVTNTRCRTAAGHVCDHGLFCDVDTGRPHTGMNSCSGCALFTVSNVMSMLRRAVPEDGTALSTVRYLAHHLVLACLSSASSSSYRARCDADGVVSESYSHRGVVADSSAATTRVVGHAVLPPSFFSSSAAADAVALLHQCFAEVLRVCIPIHLPTLIAVLLTHVTCNEDGHRLSPCAQDDHTSGAARMRAWRPFVTTALVNLCLDAVLRVVRERRAHTGTYPLDDSLLHALRLVMLVQLPRPGDASSMSSPRHGADRKSGGGCIESGSVLRAGPCSPHAMHPVRSCVAYSSTMRATSWRTRRC